mgnify:CR=1 FL=1
MKLIAGNSNLKIAEEISSKLGCPLADAEVKHFSDGESSIEIRENVRGEDVFVVEATSRPANQHVMELLIMIDALRRSSAKRITAVMPYYGYARQDSKPAPRTPITAKLVANLLSAAGADRVLTMDLHARQIQGFFDIPCDNLFYSPYLATHLFNQSATQNLTVVSPDVGGVARARLLANKINCLHSQNGLDTTVDLAIIDKRRPHANSSEVMNVIGDVNGKDCILVDDMIDTAGTICNAAQALSESGANSVIAAATHGVLSGPAQERLGNCSPISEIIITDTIQHRELISKIHVESVGWLFADAINRIHNEDSVSVLFD